MTKDDLRFGTWRPQCPFCNTYLITELFQFESHFSLKPPGCFFCLSSLHGNTGGFKQNKSNLEYQIKV